MKTLCALLSLLAFAGLGCEQQAPPVDFVARVGDEYLTREALEASLAALPARQDSAEIRRRFIDQWVVSELLYQEALRANLGSDREVQQRLQESERSVLIDALVSRLYQREIKPVTPADLRTYYERHKEQLRLREPFVRVRYLSTAEAAAAEAARAALQRPPSGAAPDSLWPALVRRYARDVEGSLALSGNYVPESRLFTEQPELRAQLLRLKPGQLAPVIDHDGTWHVLQLADRVPAGTIPELPWIEDEVRTLLTIDARKQMYQRQVQRLRTEARSRDDLVIR